MHINQIHQWNICHEKAKLLQQELANRIDLTCQYNNLSQIYSVAGCDVHFSNETVCATTVVVKLPISSQQINILEHKIVVKKVKTIFPYIPGFLSFREGPFLLSVLHKIATEPAVFIFDGQGIAHPQKMGLATHIGIILNKPTIGCAKNLLYGTYQEPPPGIRGAYTFIKDNYGEIMGIALRTKPYIKPVFVSPGYKMSIDLAGDIILACCTKYRLPEPLRLAHQLARKRLG